MMGGSNTTTGSTEIEKRADLRVVSERMKFHVVTRIIVGELFWHVLSACYSNAVFRALAHICCGHDRGLWVRDSQADPYHIDLSSPVAGSGFLDATKASTPSLVVS